MTHKYAFLLALALAGCSSSSDTVSTVTTNPTVPPPQQGTLRGVVFDGPVAGATVKAYVINPDGTVGPQFDAPQAYPLPPVPAAAQATTGADGQFDLGPLSGAFLLESSGGTYTDAATGQPVTLSPDPHLRCIISSVPSTPVVLSPLTTIAADLALYRMDRDEAPQTAIPDSNSKVTSFFGLRDIVTTIPGDPTSSQATGDLDYGLVLAGLSQEEVERGLAPFSLTTTLTQDGHDGRFDGLAEARILGVQSSAVQARGQVPPGGQALGNNTATSQLSTAITNFSRSSRNRSGHQATSQAAKLATSDGAIHTTSSYVSPYGLNFTVPFESLTADFNQSPRNELSFEGQAPPFSEWYKQSAYTAADPASWGPTQNFYPVPSIPPGANVTAWQQQRVIAVAQKYIGYDYQHHHIPDFDPSGIPNWPWNSVKSGIKNTPGLDCSNFSAWNYNYGLGLPLFTGVGQQAANITTHLGTQTCEVVTTSNGTNPIPYEFLLNTLQTGDLLYIRGNNQSRNITHVITWVGPIGRTLPPPGRTTPTSNEPLIIDSHGGTNPVVIDANGKKIPQGVHLRPFLRDSWYHNKLDHVHRWVK